MKPGDFLLGVLDFFAILLPGSVATWLVVQYIPAPVLRDTLGFGLLKGDANPDAVVLASAFLMSSYLLGHFVFMTGANVLDHFYDRWRERAKPKVGDKSFEAAEKLQQELAAGLVGGEFSTLKWARAYVQVNAPEARVEIDRLEADSKFFRSMVIVSVFAAAHFVLVRQSPVPGAIALLTIVLSYVRYREQRWKLTELTYGTAVIVHASKSTAAGQKANRQLGE